MNKNEKERIIEPHNYSSGSFYARVNGRKITIEFEIEHKGEILTGDEHALTFKNGIETLKKYCKVFNRVPDSGEVFEIVTLMEVDTPEEEIITSNFTVNNPVYSFDGAIFRVEFTFIKD